jgi:tRNA (guanine37-N1)-methyltransferase
MHLRVPRAQGEEIRNKLACDGVLDRSRKIKSENEFLYIPITREVTIRDTEIVDIESESQEDKKHSLTSALKDKLSSAEMEYVPRAFDVIGDIAVLEIPDEILSKKKIIGETLLKTFKNIKVVANKKTAVGTEYRTREMEVVAGEKRTETLHKEHGCVYKLDVTTAYFSPRLGSERLRVAEQVKEGERVLVMFAGIGPYAILIAKKRKPSEVLAIELNPSGVKYMEENVKLNKVKVKAILGDAGEEVKKLGQFDRIIMPLPKDAGDFLEATIPSLKKGGTIHYYTFTHTSDEAADEAKKICENLGHKIEILKSIECGTYSPSLSRMCVDFKIMK